MQFFSVLLDAIYHFYCILLACIPHLLPISPMQCFYRPVGLVLALGLATVISTCVTTALLLGNLPVATPAPHFTPYRHSWDQQTNLETSVCEVSQCRLLLIPQYL